MSYNKNIKSIGWGLEDGEILDDSKGIYEDFEMMFNEGEEVSFEEGLMKVKNYMESYEGGDMFEEVKSKLEKLKGSRKDSGKWVCWNVECDISLGYKVV